MHEQDLHIFRDLCLELTPFTIRGMGKPKPPGMQHLALNFSGHPLPRSGASTNLSVVATTIHRITDYRVMYRGTVHPNLMGTTGFQIHLKQGGTVQDFSYAIMGLGGTWFVGNRRHLFTRSRMASDWQMNFSL